MRSLVLTAVAVVFCSSAFAAPMPTLTKDTVGTFDRYVLNIDPNGEEYALLEFRAELTAGSFNGPSGAGFALPTGDTTQNRFEAAGGGLTALPAAVIDSTHFGLDYGTLTGQPVSTYNGVLAQLTGNDMVGTVSFAFRNAAGEYITDFGMSFPIGDNPEMVFAPVPDSVIDLSDKFADFSDLLEDAVTVVSGGTIDGEPTIDNPIFKVAAFDTTSVDVMIDRALAIQQAPGVQTGLLTLMGSDGNQYSWTVSAAVPEPSTVVLSSLALVGLVGLARRRK